MKSDSYEKTKSVHSKICFFKQYKTTPLSHIKQMLTEGDTGRL